MEMMTPSPGPGSTLRRGRESRGLSLAEVATSTKIGPRYLAALEEDAPLDDFPAPIFARLFLREYAGHLGLDDRELLRAFDRRYGPLPTPEFVKPAEIHVERSWWRRVRLRRWQRRLLASTVLLATVTAAGLAARIVWDREEAARPVQTRPGPAVAARPSAVGDLEVSASIVAREACWIRVRTDGDVVAERILEPGERVMFQADRKMVLRFGNAAGVDLEVNGEPIPTADAGVVELTFVERNGRIVAR
jgi:transcriptional regulator with XRE-family HTH domain